MSEFPAYPKELLELEWEKHKGKMAKMKKEMGVSKSLKAIKDAYKKLPTGNIEGAIDACSNHEEIAKVQGAFMAPVGECTGVLNDFVELSGAVIKEYQESKVVGKTTREYVEKMQRAAKVFRDVVDEWSLSLSQRCTQRLRTLQTAGKRLADFVKKFPGAMEEVVKQMSTLREKSEELGKVVKKFQQEWLRAVSGELTDYATICPDDQAVAKSVTTWRVLGDTTKTPKDFNTTVEFMKSVSAGYKSLHTALEKRGVL